MNIDNVRVEDNGTTVSISNDDGATANIRYTDPSAALDMNRESLETCLEGTRDLLNMGMISGKARRKFGLKWGKFTFRGTPPVHTNVDLEGIDIVIGHKVYSVHR